MNEESGLRARVAALLSSAVRAGMSPGAVAGWRVGETPPFVVAVGAGAVRDCPRPVAASTWYDLASLTKPLVAGTLALVAFAEGRLGLDVPVRDVLPELAGAPLGECRVRSLLTHTSGLPAWAPVYALAANRRDRMLAALARIPLESAEGTRVRYSCLGFLLLGAAIERAFDQALDVVFRQRVLRPLGLEHQLGYRPAVDRVQVAAGALTSSIEERLTVEAGLDPRCVPLRRHGDPDDGNSRFLGGVAANAGLFGTAEGVLRLAGLYLRDDGGGVLDRELATLSTREHTPGMEQSRGLAWQLAATPGSSAGPRLAAAAFGHTGFTGTSIWLDPSRSLAITLLTNRLHPGGRQIDLHPLRRALHRVIVEGSMSADDR